MNNFRLSIEFFPTKTEAGHKKLLATRAILATEAPDFFSVTYGAGGSTRGRTLSIVSELNELGVPAAPHLSCVGDSIAELRDLLNIYKENGVNRIVALRGDLPSGMKASSGELRYANELVEFIRVPSGPGSAAARAKTAQAATLKIIHHTFYQRRLGAHDGQVHAITLGKICQRLDSNAIGWWHLRYVL